MTGRRRGHLTAVSGEELVARSTALTEALDIARDRVDPDWRDRARTVVRKIAERSALGSGHTVVALAGATGSGKSTLFNALVRAEVSRTGVRRPTTSTATAALWGQQSAAALLDWLGVGARHQVTQESTDLDGLVLLDLPDFDSREIAHRTEADRVLALADVFIWVTDPQKYADAVIHDEYIRALSARDAKTVVLLNQADRLTVAEVEQTTADLQRLLERDGVKNVSVLPTSGTTGAGLEPLVEELADIVQARNAAEHRMLSDLRTIADQLRSQVGDSEVRLDEQTDARLVAALARAAGVPVVLGAVQRDYLQQAIRTAGWPFTKWARRFRPDPLRRLGLGRGAGQESDEGVRIALGRSSLPTASPSQRAEVELATRDIADRAAKGLPLRWAHSVERAAVPEQSGLADGLDQAILSTSLQTRRPIWWTVVAVFQWIFAAAAVAGLVWLLTLIVLGWLQINVETPAWGPIPYPTLLLAGGLILGLLLTAMMRIFARIGARHRRDVVQRRLHSAISEAAASHVMVPVRRVLDDHRRTRELLQQAGR